ANRRFEMPQKTSPRRPQRPAQSQSRRPGHESEMTPKPESSRADGHAGARLDRRVALVTGGDSGIGRAVAIAFAREGANVAIVYLNEHEDARETARLVEEHGHDCLAIAGDVGDEAFCRDAVEQVVQRFGRLDVLVN